MTANWRARVLPKRLRGLLLYLVLVAMAPILLVQVGGWLWSFHTQQKAMIESNLEVARGLALAFDGFVADVGRKATGISAAIDPQKSVPLSEIIELLNKTAEEYPPIYAFLVASMDGQVIAANKPEFLQINISDRDFFQQAIQTDDWVLSNLFISRPDYKPIFVIIRTLRSDDGVAYGVFVAGIRPEALAMVLDIKRAEGGSLCLFDRHGRLVFRDPPVDISWERRLDYARTDRFLTSALHGREAAGTIYSPFRAQDILAARAPIGSTGWVAGTGMPRALLLASLRSGLLTSGILSLSAAGVSIVLALIISQRIARSIDSLHHHARVLGGGDLSHRTGSSAIIELNELGQAFNLMAEHLQEAQTAREKALDELGRSNRDLEQFAYVASHDLQEPLRMIAGYMDLLRERYQEQLNDQALEYMAFAVDGAKRMQKLISDLLAYSRVSTRAAPIGLVSVEDVFHQVQHDLAGMIGQYQAEITHDSLPQVKADRSQMHHLLINLVSNAIKFRGDQPPRIHVSAQRGEGEWRFSVQDNGIGLDMRHAERIFLIFQRLHTAREYPGTGVGLAICKRIVDRHGGRIWVESEPGRGATFFFTIPDQVADGSSAEKGVA